LKRWAGEGLRPDQRQQQLLAERDVKTGQREDDEAGRRHPMHSALECGEPHNGAPGAAGFDHHHAAEQIEDHQQRQHAEDHDGGDDRQGLLVECAPVTAGRLLDRAGLLIRDRATAGNPIELLEELILLHRACGRVDL